GGAIMMEQTHFTPDRVAAEIARLAADPDKLAEMADAARRQGVLDAADRLGGVGVRGAKGGGAAGWGYSLPSQFLFHSKTELADQRRPLGFLLGDVGGVFL